MKSVALAGAGLALGGAVFVGLRAAISVALGATLAVGNLWVLARVVAALLPADSVGASAQSRVAWALVALLKMGGLFAVVWLLMRHGVVDPLAMLVGFMALPIGIAIGSLVSDRSAVPEDR
jgi:ATP synthase I chain